MVDEEIRDPDRIATLLGAEIEGLTDPPFRRLSVETTTGGGPGEPAFIVRAGERTVFEATKQDDRLVLEFRTRPDAVAEAAEAAGLRARPKATTPPATLVFVERAAAVKRVIDVLRASHESQ